MRKLNWWFGRIFYKKLTKEDLLGYKSILKLINHKDASDPILDITKQHVKYYILVPKIKMDLIIDSEHAEIINSEHVWPIKVNRRVYERAINIIKKKKEDQINRLEHNIKGRKLFIMQSLYQKIK
jgi:hypothetical protein